MMGRMVGAGAAVRLTGVARGGIVQSRFHRY